ncbi:MAG: FAD-binding oxidoreductase [Acidimicrobiia bacterium]
MIHRPFWVDDHPRPAGLGESTLPAEVDYLVVGSGLTGLSAGHRIAGSGKSVAVVDSGEIAGGASAINGGMVSPDVKAGMRSVEQSHGRQLADEIWQATVRSIEIVEELCERLGIDAMVNRSGMAALGLDQRDHKRFEATATWYRERYGVEWEVLGPNRVGEIAGSDSFTSAMFEPEGYGIHPARFSFGLARALADMGGTLVADCAVDTVEQSGAGFEVTTSKGTIRAGGVIVATNGYTTRRPLPELRNRVVPIGSYIIVTEPLDADLAKSVFPANAMTYTKRRLLNYMRRTPDHRILIGGRRNLKTDLPLEDSAADLRSSLIRYFPQLTDATITHVWGGKLGVPFDLTPHIGQIDGVWYAMGYAGHGVGLSTLLGHDLAGMLLGEDPTSPFAKIPHNGRFYYRGHPWFLNPASLLYRTLDKVGM